MLDELTHTDEKPLACTECPYRTKYRFALNRHTTQVHSKDRPFKCNECSYSAATLSLLTAHRVVHSDEKPFACSECDYTSKFKSGLKNHKIQHHSAELPFKCDKCAYSAARFCHLLPYDVGPARAFLGEAEKTMCGFRPCIAGQVILDSTRTWFTLLKHLNVRSVHILALQIIV